MDLKNIQDLIKLVKKADISELSVKEGDVAITIKNKGADQPVVYSQAPPQPAAKAVNNPQESKQESTVAGQKPGDTANQEGMSTFRSPMVGTFYRKPGAD